MESMKTGKHFSLAMTSRQKYRIENAKTKEETIEVLYECGADEDFLERDTKLIKSSSGDLIFS